MHLVQNIQDIAESSDKSKQRIHPNNNYDTGTYRQNAFVSSFFNFQVYIPTGNSMFKIVNE